MLGVYDIVEPGVFLVGSRDVEVEMLVSVRWGTDTLNIGSACSILAKRCRTAVDAVTAVASFFWQATFCVNHVMGAS